MRHLIQVHCPSNGFVTMVIPCKRLIRHSAPRTEVQIVSPMISLFSKRYIVLMLSKIVRTRRTSDREKLPCISIGDYIVTLIFCSNSIPITIISSALVQILEIQICHLKNGDISHIIFRAMMKLLPAYFLVVWYISMATGTNTSFPCKYCVMTTLCILLQFCLLYIQQRAIQDTN